MHIWEKALCKNAYRLNTGSFDWALVRSFLAVLNAGSLTGAARASGILQPTLSRHIAELETQLGVTLFERTGRGLAPTHMASALADVAQGMEHAANAIVQTVVGQRTSMQGTVRVACSPMVASYLMPPILARFGEIEPTIQIELVASPRLSNLLRREADIAVRMVRPEQQSLIARKLADLQIGAVAHERYLSNFGMPAGAADLLRHRLLGYDQDKTILSGMAMLGMPVSRSVFALRTDDQVAYARLVAEGAGIGFVPLYALPALPGVVQLMHELSIPTVPLWLVVHREIADNRVIRRVYDFLGQAIPEALAGI
jgi:DNA-binding transcriptional LysR family regulator